MNYSNGPLVFWQLDSLAMMNEEGDIPLLSLPDVILWLLTIVANILLSVSSTVK